MAKPRFLRPFWVRGRCDGMTAEPAFGPRTKAGRCEVTFAVAHKGESIRAVRVICESDGTTQTIRVTLDSEAVARIRAESGEPWPMAASVTPDPVTGAPGLTLTAHRGGM